MLSGEDFRRMALFSGDDPSVLIGNPECMDKNFLLSPWPWDGDNTPFTLDDNLTDIVLNISPRGYHPEMEELLFLERLSALWDGRVSASLQINEQQMENGETARIAEALSKELLPLYGKGYFSEIIWDLAISPQREDVDNLELLLNELRKTEKGKEIPYIYALKREEKPVEPLWDRADEIIIKAYDFSGRHSTYENAEESIVNFIRRKGKDPSSLILSIPLYGRKFPSSDPDYWIKQIPYKELVDCYHPERDCNEKDDYYFNGPDLAVQKTILAKEKELKGVALYPFEWDSRGPYSLKEALSAVPE